MRLNTNQFLALRSIAREPWDMQGDRIQWRFNGKWCYLFRRYGVRAPLGSVNGIGGHCGYNDVYERAWSAGWELEEKELVEVVTERCCHNASCNGRNDRHEFRLTPRGNALLQKANTTSQQRNTAEHPTPEAPSVSWWHKAASLFPWVA